ncbi:MAG: cell division protein SepF [Lachnospira sp.]|nr:cell division protein SepF [Lachnospira sp.]
MKFNKLLDIMRLKPDDYDDEDEIYDDDYDFEEDYSSKPTKKTYDVDDEVESPTKVKLESYVKKNNNTKTKNNNNGRVISMQQRSSLEVCVIKPKSFDEEVKEISDTLLSGRAVVLNLEGLQLDIAQRIIDYTSGACSAINGNLQKISNFIIIATPATVDLSGDFQNGEGIFDLSKFDF